MVFDSQIELLDLGFKRKTTSIFFGIRVLQLNSLSLTTNLRLISVGAPIGQFLCSN